MKKEMSNKNDSQLPCSHGAQYLEPITPLAKRLNCLDIKVIGDICIDEIPPLVGGKFASLYILDDSSNILHLVKNNHPFLINNIVSLNQNPPSPMVSAVRSRDLLLMNDIESHKKPGISKERMDFSHNYSTKSCIIAPLICQDRVEGVLNLGDKIDGKKFSAEDVAVIELFRQLIGESIGNVKLFERIQRQAETDGLTGMLNHRVFYEMLEIELRRSQRYGGQISIIMADIDNLKPVNDSFGHRAGDYVIKQVSRRIGACIRQIDIAARYGGDEFAVILPNTSIADAVVVAERMLAMVADSPMFWEEHEIKLSISIGVGQYNEKSQPGDVTKATDQAMYAAKQAGKNTIRVFESTQTS